MTGSRSAGRPVRWWCGLAALAAVAPGAVVVSVVAAQDRVSNVASAWIDDPLDRTEAPLAPLEIVGHATSQEGLARLELIVDDAVVDDAPGGDGLVLGRWTWTPAEPGAHRIVVRGVETESSYVDSALVTVFVGGAPDVVAGLVGSGSTTTTTGPAATTAPGATTVVTGTTLVPTTVPPTTLPRTTPPSTTAPPTTRRTTAPTTPPTTGCEIQAPVLVSPTGGTTVEDRTPRLSWDQPGGCDPAGWYVEVTSDPDFGGIDASGSPETDSWTVPVPLENCTMYFWHVRANVGRASGPWSDIASFRTDLGGC